MVANGHVYVASYKQLTIFGLAAPGAKVRNEAEPQTTSVQEQAEPALPGHVVYGTLARVEKSALTLETRTGTATVDAAPAEKAGTQALPVVGRAYMARGEYDKQGVPARRIGPAGQGSA